MPFRSIISGFLATISVVCAASGAARASEYHSSYSIAFSGLPIAQSDFVTRITGEDYAITGTLRSSGLASVIARTRGEASIQGRIGSKAAQPTLYDLRYTYGSRSKTTRIEFSGGRASSTVSNPPPRERPDKVPLQPGDLVGVVDPMSLGLLVADAPQGVCARTIRVYDGEVVADLVLSYSGQKPFKTDGFEGLAVECRARFVPVGGYRKGHRSIESLRQGQPIRIGFAPLDGTNLYAAVTARIETYAGTVNMRATRLQRVGS